MLFLLLGMAPAIIAQPLQQLEEANQAFLDKNFEEAIGLYESILQDGYYAPGLYYNLGNAYFRVGKLGKAILHYERALKWSPDDEQVLQNLEIARSQLKDDLLVVPESGLVRRWHAVQGALSSDTWATVGLVFLWLGLGGLALWLLHWVRRYKKAGFIAGWLFLALSILPLLLAFGRARQEHRSDGAIVMVAETVLRVAPDEESRQALLLHEGVKVRIQDAIGSWYQVRLSDTTEGWLPKDAVEKI